MTLVSVKVVLGAGALVSIISLLYFMSARQGLTQGFEYDSPQYSLGSTVSLSSEELELAYRNKSSNYQGPFLSLAHDPNCTPCKEGTGIHLITNFFPVTHPKWSAGLGMQMENAESETQKRKWHLMLKQRQQELQDVLQMNLNHRLVAAVYILYDHPYVLNLLSKLKLKNKEKLVLHKVGKDPTYRHALDYANNYLIGKFVVFANQDIYLGEGWELLNKAKMGDKKIMYALSRHGQQERFCRMRNYCDFRFGYIGSHDTFTFVLKEKLSKDGLKELDHKSDDYGLENILIWTFKTKFHFKVLNPCFKLRTYHVHCIKIHNKARPRLNDNGESGHADFTGQME